MDKAQAIQEIYKACIEIHRQPTRLVSVGDAAGSNASLQASEKIAQIIGAWERAVCSRKEDELRAENERVKHENGRLLSALEIVLPMAKGYAAQHKVGQNAAKIELAERAIDHAKKEQGGE